MFKIEVDTKELNKAVENIIRENIVDNIFTESQELIVRKEIIDRGTLLRSGKIEDQGEMVWEISYTAPHSVAIEFGSEPHWIPIKPLKKWSQRKLGNEDIAYAVRAKIAKEGTDPRPFLRPARDKILSKYHIL